MKNSSAMCRVGQIRGLSLYRVPHLRRETQQHELGENQGFHGGDAPGGVADAGILQDRGLQQHQGAEADIEVGGECQEFLEFLGGSMAHRYLSRGFFTHGHFPDTVPSDACTAAS